MSAGPSPALMSNYGRLDVTFSHGQGATLYDTEGKAYFDALCGIAVCSLGHAHPGVRDAIAEQKETGGHLKKRLVQFLLEDSEPMLYHHEPILRDGKIAGFLTSGSYGHTLGGSVGLGYVRDADGVNTDMLAASDWAVDIGGQIVPVKPSLRAMYDPKGERMRA